VEEILTRLWDMLVGRLDPPLTFRLVVQPAVAAVLAIRAGLNDARAGRPAYGMTVITDPLRRHELLREGWRDVTGLFVVAIIIDVAYQIMVFSWIYPGQAIIVAATLAFPPYLLVRGPANRIAAWLRGTRVPSRRTGRF
jgi:hypothetical protein